MAIFYSARFAVAVGILRWICLGATMQVMTWPMGFIIIAKGEQIIFFACELAWTVVSVGLAWLCVGYLGINGAGIAFFGSYVFHYLLIYPVVNRLSGFTWSPENRLTGLLYVGVIGGVFCALYFLPRVPALGTGAAMSLASSFYSSRAVLKTVPLERMPLLLRRLVAHPRDELD
jgi:PST family polysaccharide transporter